MKTIFEDFSDEFPTYNNTEVRNRLGRFLFGEEDIKYLFKRGTVIV